MTLGRDNADLDTVDQADRREAPALSAVVRAATATDANLVLTEPGATGHRDGIGALLRYSY
ncbi:MAG: hypothetical protein GEV10_10085 [Streptosporangiales bacterium]|nr:hypothetical protein [Streptosporangiales bacterium]